MQSIVGLKLCKLVSIAQLFACVLRICIAHKQHTHTHGRSHTLESITSACALFPFGRHCANSGAARRRSACCLRALSAFPLAFPHFSLISSPSLSLCSALRPHFLTQCEFATLSLCLILFVLADGAYTQRTAILKNSFVVICVPR